MTEEELRAWLKRPEGEGLEFKEAQNSVPQNVYTTVSAFANTNGGWLIFGVSDEGMPHEITGIDASKIDEVQNAFLSTLNSGQKLNIRIEATAHHHEIDGKHVLAFHIPEAQRHEKPIYLGGHPKNSYFRRGASNVLMQEHQWKGFIRDADDVSWDSVAFENADIATGIDADTLDWYMRKFYQHNPDEQEISDHTEFLLKWHFAKYVQDAPVLTRGAVMLFGKIQLVRGLIIRPVLDYQRYDIRFENWVNTGDWQDRKEFEGNLFTTWQGLMERYLRLADHASRIDPATMSRIDEPPDLLAFRESAANLLIHQDYRSGAKATIRWFIDWMQFENPGDARGEILLESHTSIPRNPIIVDAFRRIRLSEEAGTGIPKISKNWHDLAYRPPQIKNDKIDKFFVVALAKEPLMTEAMREIFASMELPKEQAEILAAASTQGTITKIDAIMAIGGDRRQAHVDINGLLEQKLLVVEEEGKYVLGRRAIKELEWDQPRSSVYIPRNLEIIDDSGKHSQMTDMEFANLPQPKVLLGAPGGGKTSVCQEIARQLNGQLVRADDVACGFFNIRPEFEGQILVIDGLDEVSSKPIPEAFAEIIKTIKNLGYDNWLISCRSYEWRKESFSQQIKSVFQQSPKIAHLGDLSGDEIKAFLEVFPADEPAEQFIKNAEEKEATDFLQNPQTLQMLVQAVRSGGWPKTKTKLFHTACEVMASEDNPSHQEKNPDRPNEEKIIEIAGWVCVQLLMSGGQAIALGGQGSENIPRPADLEASEYSIEDIKAACQTKLFKSPVAGRVEPTHRTVAEFLAGRWLAKAFKAEPRKISPVRVMNYLTSFGTSAIPPDLHGLYAWIVSLDDSNRRRQNIKHNPYVCLRYGDLSGFSKGACVAFLKEFRIFAEKDPFFIGEDWYSQLNRGLGREDSIKDDFIDTISNGAPHQLVVALLRAIQGTELANAMVDDLKAIVLDEKISLSERLTAIDALEDSLEATDWVKLADCLLEQSTKDSLRISIDGSISKKPELFFGEKIADHIIAYEKVTGSEGTIGVGCRIPRQCSAQQVLKISQLLAAEMPMSIKHNKREGSYNLEIWLGGLLLRLFKVVKEPTTHQIWPIVSRLNDLVYGDDGREETKSWFNEHDDIRREIQSMAIKETECDIDRWEALRWLSDSTMGLHMRESDIVYHLEELMLTKDTLPGWKNRWRDLVMLGRDNRAFDGNVLNFASEQVKDFPELKPILDDILDPPVNEHESKFEKRRREWREKEQAKTRKRHKSFSAIREAMEQGERIDALGAAAEAVLGHYSDLNQATSPKESITEMVGQENLVSVIAGFEAAVKRDDIPSVEYCADLWVNKSRVHYLELISLAHSMLTIEVGKSLTSLPKKAQLCALSASWSEFGINREELSKKTRENLQNILFKDHRTKRKFVKDMIVSSLKAGKENPPGFYYFIQEEMLSDILPDIALEWLTKFEDMNEHRLCDLLKSVIGSGDHKKDLIKLADDRLKNNTWASEGHRRTWHVAAFLLDFDYFYAVVRKFANEDENHLWTFGDLASAREYGKSSALSLSIEQIAFLLETFAPQWPDSSPPSGGWSGSNNPWDASRWLNYLIKMLSERKSEKAIKCLENLATSKCMDTYQDNVKHELAVARRALAETRHQEVNLEDVREILLSGKPVNVSDLQALFIEKFEEYQAKIRTGHTDAYKIFWDRDEPHVENYCRDRLLDGLEQEMGAYGVRVHKEGTMANEIRVDLLFSCGDFDLPVEIKRQWHPDIWTAAHEQLEERYSENYRTDGTGVYLVIWHGDVEGKMIPKPPIGERPKSAEEMLQTLLDNSGDLSPKTKIVVLDVSKPERNR